MRRAIRRNSQPPSMAAMLRYSRYSTWFGGAKQPHGAAVTQSVMMTTAIVAGHEIMCHRCSRCVSSKRFHLLQSRWA